MIRATAGTQSHGQVLCANIDFACAVVSLHPAPVVSKVERLLTLAWESGAHPLVVLTKSDLVSDADLIAEDVAAAAPDLEVVCCSAVSGAGVDRLLELVDGRLTLALLGASGHGKSALTNALAGATVLATKAIREDGRGRHTSVRRELVPLPGGGVVIDTPGLRSMGLAEAARGLAGAFGDIETLAGDCRFADCSHESEVGCAIRAALAAGKLSLRRFESWSKLRREAASMAERRDVRVRRQRARHGKKARREMDRKPHLDV